MQRTEEDGMAAPAAQAGFSAALPASSANSDGAISPSPAPPRPTDSHTAPRPVEAPVMDAAAWTAALRAAVDSEGGALANGWQVQVKRRPTGARDVTITSTEGRKYRSIVQAVAVLTGAANGAGGAGSSQPSSRPARKRSQFGHKAAGEPADGTPAKRRRRQQQDGRRRGSGAAAGSQQQGQQGAGEDDSSHPVFGQLLAKARLLVARIRRELDVLEAYEAEGWRGANKGRLVVAEETQRAERQADRLRQELRELLQRCEAGEGRAIPANAYDSDGGLDQAHMFCAVCGRGDSTDDNDIVLCDGPCRRAYHERCCIPPFRLAELQEDADWLCPACHAKDEILDLVNETLETEYELDTPSEAVLAEGEGRRPPDPGPAAGGGTWAALLGGDLVSSDGEDESFRGASGSEDAAPGSPCSERGASSSGSESSSSSGSEASEDSAEIVEGGRRRTAVDYVALADAMFGGRSESEHGSDSEGEWT